MAIGLNSLYPLRDMGKNVGLLGVVVVITSVVHEGKEQRFYISECGIVSDSQILTDVKCQYSPREK